MPPHVTVPQNRAIAAKNRPSCPSERYEQSEGALRRGRLVSPEPSVGTSGAAEGAPSPKSRKRPEHPCPCCGSCMLIIGPAGATAQAPPKNDARQPPRLATPQCLQIRTQKAKSHQEKMPGPGARPPVCPCCAATLLALSLPFKAHLLEHRLRPIPRFPALALFGGRQSRRRSARHTGVRKKAQKAEIAEAQAICRAPGGICLRFL